MVEVEIDEVKLMGRETEKNTKEHGDGLVPSVGKMHDNQ